MLYILKVFYLFVCFEPKTILGVKLGRSVYPFKKYSCKQTTGDIHSEIIIFATSCTGSKFKQLLKLQAEPCMTITLTHKA